MKITKTTRVFLTVEIEDPAYMNPSPNDWANHGRKKMDEVKRLLRASGIDDLGRVDFEVDAPTVCSFCGYDWEEDADGPMCCGSAQVEWHLAHPTPDLGTAMGLEPTQVPTIR